MLRVCRLLFQHLRCNALKLIVNNRFENCSNCHRQENFSNSRVFATFKPSARHEFAIFRVSTQHKFFSQTSSSLSKKKEFSLETLNCILGEHKFMRNEKFFCNDFDNRIYFSCCLLRLVVAFLEYFMNSFCDIFRLNSREMRDLCLLLLWIDSIDRTVAKSANLN